MKLTELQGLIRKEIKKSLSEEIDQVLEGKDVKKIVEEKYYQIRFAGDLINDVGKIIVRISDRTRRYKILKIVDDGLSINVVNIDTNKRISIDSHMLKHFLLIDS